MNDYELDVYTNVKVCPTSHTEFCECEEADMLGSGTVEDPSDCKWIYVDGVKYKDTWMSEEEYEKQLSY